MSPKVRFALAFHDHQPVGNFDWTIEDAYQQSYLPFLDVFTRPEYDCLKISMHHSGCLAEWLDAHHPEYLDRLAELAERGRIEILGGPFQEPILAMIPPRDRVGQIRAHSEWLERRLKTQVRGMWMPERVWEPAFVDNLVKAGMEFTLVDDYHFKKTGLKEDQLWGYYITEDNGSVMAVFPGSEKLRYWIPFQNPQKTIEYCRVLQEEQPDAVLVFADDGEKFGTWPETHKHVYDDGWLVDFFDTLVENADWLQTVTLSEALDNVKPLGKRYLPECSYREMTEWVLPAERLVEYEDALHQMPQRGDSEPWDVLRPFLAGGNWRNFKVKYPESNDMYARMMYVSRRFHEKESRISDPALDKIRLELYRGQCNCPYWHGAFGGVYLPHLRNGVYERLISADNQLDALDGHLEPGAPKTIEASDFNFDMRDEFRVADENLIAWLSPSEGGTLYGLDVRSRKMNLLATLARRPEAYHQKILRYNPDSGEDFASIHDRIHFKQEGLEKRLQYDTTPRRSLKDLFFAPKSSAETQYWGTKLPDTTFVTTPYRVEEQDARRGEMTLVATAMVPALDGSRYFVTIRKTFRLLSGETGCEVRYELRGMPPTKRFRFGVEWNVACLPGHCDDRYFCGARGRKLGNLSTRLNILNTRQISLKDEWLGMDVSLEMSPSAKLWTYPVETVSNSEGGFEAVHQSVALVPYWNIQTTDGTWRGEFLFRVKDISR